MLIYFLLIWPMFIKVDTSVIGAMEIDNRQIDLKEHVNFNSKEVWGPLLEDYVTTNNKRQARVLKTFTPSEEIVSDAKKNDQSRNDKKESKISSGNKVINNGAYTFPNTVYTDKPNQQSHQVTETDLYLLGAIEKLVRRIDFMEKRLRRLEQMLFYAMAGNRIDQEPCRDNFTRVASGCYLFISTAIRVGDWKMASKYCRRLGTQLVEFETPEEYQDIISFLQITPELKGKDFWTGGLNPGLLWIWSNSGRPIYTSSKAKRIEILNSSLIIQTIVPENRETNRRKRTLTSIEAKTVKSKNENKLNSGMAGAIISGQGPCLRLEYVQGMRMYIYKGTDCSARFYYICEQGDISSSNEIQRLGQSRNILSDEL